MSHNIFGERFYTNDRNPAWHALGQNFESDSMGALEALKLIGGDYAVTLQPMQAQLPDGTLIDVPQRAIIRHPTQDDPVFRPFGTVNEGYSMITQADVCEVWDRHVTDARGKRRPVETIGLLRQGALFFITTRLPRIDVRGDEVERYLGVVAPMDGLTSATMEEWDLRVVCNNTLTWAQQKAIQRFTIAHRAGAKEALGEWLKAMVEQAIDQVKVIKEAYEVLATYSPTAAEVTRVLRYAYPLPGEPKDNAPPEVMKRRRAYWEQECARINRYKDGAAGLYAGDGRGMDTRACKGTTWGLYNAVVETEDYRKGWNVGGEEAQRVAESTLFGLRRSSKVRAFEACMKVASK